MKNRLCPYKNGGCWSYGENNCDGCPVGEKFTAQARKIKRLKAELKKLEGLEGELKALDFVVASLANELNMTDEEFAEEVEMARKKAKGDKK